MHARRRRMSPDLERCRNETVFSWKAAVTAVTALAVSRSLASDADWSGASYICNVYNRLCASYVASREVPDVKGAHFEGQADVGTRDTMKGSGSFVEKAETQNRTFGHISGHVPHTSHVCLSFMSETDSSVHRFTGNTPIAFESGAFQVSILKRN
jgi:hypothetical protein